MNDTEFSVNADEVLKMFSEFDSKKRKGVFRTAIRKALNIVKKQAASNLKSAIRPSMYNHIDKWGNSFKKGIAIKIYRNADEGFIHIMKNFKLKFFELGTKERYAKKYKGRNLRKRRSTGKIQATHFFTRARDSKEREVFSSIDKALAESIIKINNKHR